MEWIVVLLSAVLVVNCSEKLNEAKHHLIQYGYYSENQYGGGNLEEAIKHYQQAYGLNVTGVIDKATYSLMSESRCGMKDDVVEGYAADKGWNKRSLSYYFYNYGEDLPRDILEAKTARAFKYWSDVTRLTFTKQEGSGDIKMGFGGRRHLRADKRYCSFKFDGKGHVLAHAYKPPAGRLHFDEDELFTAEGHKQLKIVGKRQRQTYGWRRAFMSEVQRNMEKVKDILKTKDKWIVLRLQDGCFKGSGYGYKFIKRCYRNKHQLYIEAGKNYLWVAAHEIGHVLGLQHDTETPGSIMYPIYKGRLNYGESSIKLHAHDIERIRKLYGTKIPPPPRPPTTPATTPRGCYDAGPGCEKIIKKCQVWKKYMKRRCSKTCNLC